MPSSRKKVIVRKINRDWLAGYLAPDTFLRTGELEILDLAGKVIALPVADVKWVCFVRDFNSGEAGNPERLLRKSFAGKPRSEGLRLRIRITDDDQLEGLAANDLSLLNPGGIFLSPPDNRSNTQRVFIPRSSIAEIEIVSVITSPSRRKMVAAPPATQASLQEDLFRETE